MNYEHSENFTEKFLALRQSDFDAEECRRSLKFFVTHFWDIVEPSSSYIDNWHIDAIIEHLEAVTKRQIRKLLINIPPRMMKSTLVSVMWPAWTWIQDPAHRWLCATYAQNLSRRDAVKMRRIVESPRYISLFGHFVFEEDQNTKDKFENNRKGCRISTSVGGSVTGEGGDTIMVDDPHNAAEIYSDVKRRGVITWWREAMSSRLNDPSSGAKVIIMQRLHEEDLAGWVLENDNFEHLCLPMEFDPSRKFFTSIGFKDPREKEGDLLFPSRMSRKQCDEEQKRMGSIGYAGQMQQEPISSQGNIVKAKDIQYYEKLPESFEQQHIFIDPSFEGDEKSDYCVVQRWGRNANNYYFIDMIRGKWNYPDAKFHVKQFFDRFEKGTFPGAQFEKKANGHAMLAEFKDKYDGITSFEPKVSKEARLYEVLPLIEAHQVHFPKDDPNAATVVKESLIFPLGRNDDCLDVMVMALLYFKKNSTESSSFETFGERKY